MTQIEGERWGFGADKVNGEAGSEALAETLIWILGEGCSANAENPIMLTRKASDMEPELTCVIDTAPRNPISSSKNQFPTLTHRYEENGC